MCDTLDNIHLPFLITRDEIYNFYSFYYKSIHYLSYKVYNYCYNMSFIE